MINSAHVPIFIISLPNAVERRSYILKNLSLLDVRFSFIKATSPVELPPKKQNSAIACWDSHVKALSKFLLSDANFACIFEDDIDLSKRLKYKKRFFINIEKIANGLPKGYSIIQFGTVSFRRRNWIAIGIREFYFLCTGFYRFDQKAYLNLKNSIGSKVYEGTTRNFKELLGITSKLVDGFGTGMQAYIINRKAAEFLVTYYFQKNDWDPTSKFSMDTLLEQLSRHPETNPEVRTIRISKQLFEQRRIPTMNNFFPGNDA